MSTASDREAALRRALLSAAEYIEPAPGGFERIQERLGRPRPVLVAWLEAAWTVLVMRAPDVIEAVRRRAAEVTRLVWDRFGPKAVTGPGPQRLSWLRWMRPLVAMSVAVFVIGAGVYVGLASPAAIFNQAGSSVLPNSGEPGTHPGPPGSRGSGGPLGSGSQGAYSPAPGSSGSKSTCNKKSTPSFHAPTGPSSSSPGQSTTPGTSTSPTTSSPASPSPPDSSSPGASSPATTGNSAGVPNAGLASGNPAAGGTGINGNPSTMHSVRRGAGSVSVSQPAGPSPATTGNSRPSNKNPCSKTTHRKKAKTGQLTSAWLTDGQPGGSVAAKLD